MHSKDYLLRIIEQIGPVLAALRRRILGRWAGEEADEASIQDELRELTGQVGLDLEIARVATPDTLAMLVAPTGELEPGRCWVLAESLYLDGLDRELQGDEDEAHESFVRALRLYEMVESGGLNVVGFPEASERVAEIAGRVREGGNRRDSLFG